MADESVAGRITYWPRKVKKRNDANKTVSPCIPLPDGRCVWHKLPQEIKDIIFELAYVSDGLCEPMHKSSWQPRVCTCHDCSGGTLGYCAFHSHSCGQNLRLETSWNPKVPMEDLMVDHEWYRAAWKVLYSRTNFLLKHNTEYDDEENFAIQHRQGQQMEEFIIDSNGRARSYAKLITTITFELDVEITSISMIKVARMCPSLKHVHIRFGNIYFDDYLLDGDCSFNLKLLTEDEWERYDARLFQLRGMSTLTVDCPDGSHSSETFCDNLRILEHLIRSTASQPRPTDWYTGPLDDATHDNGSHDSTQLSDESSSDSDKVAHASPWDRLPEELKEDILVMAYVPHRRVVPLPKAPWDAEEDRRRKRQDYEARWFPGKLIERFLVSREWYRISSSAYYKHTEFYFNIAKKMLEFVAQDSKAYQYAHRIGNATVYLERCDSFLADAISFCTSLKTLRLEIRYDFFDDSSHADTTPQHSIEEADWSEQDFERFQPTASLLRLPHLPRIQIAADARKTETQFLRNLALLEVLLHRAASQSSRTFAQADELQKAEISSVQATAKAGAQFPQQPSGGIHSSDIIRSCDIPDDSTIFRGMCEHSPFELHEWALRQV